jgi:hypothetical protein
LTKQARQPTATPSKLLHALGASTDRNGQKAVLNMSYRNPFFEANLNAMFSNQFSQRTLIEMMELSHEILAATPQSEVPSEQFSLAEFKSILKRYKQYKQKRATKATDRSTKSAPLSLLPNSWLRWEVIPSAD